MKAEDHPRFTEAIECGLKPHSHGSAPNETVWIEDSRGYCCSIDRMDEVIAETIWISAEEG